MRYLPFVLGPELYWILASVGVKWVTRRSLPPDPAVTRWLDQYWAVLPLVIVPLTFCFFLWPGPGRWSLLLRIDVAIAIGIVWTATKYCEGMTYHEPSAGPGAGTGWLVMIILGYTLMILGTIISAGLIWWRSRA